MKFLKKIWKAPLTWGTIISMSLLSIGIIGFICRKVFLDFFKKDKDDDQTKETE